MAAMKLIPVDRKQFSLWKAMRQELYSALGDPFHEEEMRHIHSSDEWYCRLVADTDGEIIGLVEISLRNIVDGCLSSPVPYLEGLFLMPKHRGLGVGTAVVEILLEWAADQGYREFATDAELANTGAQRFYKRLGFTEVDRVVEYKVDLKDRIGRRGET